MRIRKSHAVIAFAVLFGGIGFALGCVTSAVLVLVNLRGGDHLTAALLVPAAVLAFALLGAGVGVLFARLGDPADPGSSAGDEAAP